MIRNADYRNNDVALSTDSILHCTILSAMQPHKPTVAMVMIFGQINYQLSTSQHIEHTAHTTDGMTCACHEVKHQNLDGERRKTATHKQDRANVNSLVTRARALLEASWQQGRIPRVGDRIPAVD